MIETVLTKTFEAPQININEIRRYAGSRYDFNSSVIDDCIAELSPYLTYSVCYREFPIEKTEDGLVNLSFTESSSKAATKLLQNSSRIVLFAATVGLHPDILITKNSTLSPVKSLFFSAYGSERVEALCDAFMAFYEKEYELTLTHRFSPGYSDLPLSVQTDVFKYLAPERKIGITLNSSLLMSPSKSVTAFAGIINA